MAASFRFGKPPQNVFYFIVFDYFTDDLVKEFQK